MSWPLITLSDIYHVGSLDKSKKRPNSHEGLGLSISTEPDAWKRINPFTEGSTYQCIKKGNRFLDFHALKYDQKQCIIDWGLEQNYIEKQTQYRVRWYDDELEDMLFIDFSSYQEAIDNLDEGYELKTLPHGTVMTPLMQEKVGATDLETNPLDLLTTLYADEKLGLDGVWWNDRLNIFAYSAPRGVIFERRLPDWTFNAIVQ